MRHHPLGFGSPLRGWDKVKVKIQLMMQRCWRNRSQPRSFSTLARGEEPSSRRYVDVRHHARLPRLPSQVRVIRLVIRGFCSVVPNTHAVGSEGQGKRRKTIPTYSTGSAPCGCVAYLDHKLIAPQIRQGLWCWVRTTMSGTYGACRIVHSTGGRGGCVETVSVGTFCSLLVC